MSLLTAIQNGVDAAFKAVAPISKAGVVRHYTGTNTRNSTTGEYTRGYTDYTEPNAVPVDMKKYEDRADLLATDIGIVVRSKYVLAIHDEDSVIYDGKTYRIIGIKPDPTQTIYEILMREAT